MRSFVFARAHQLPRYLALMTHQVGDLSAIVAADVCGRAQMPIESRFVEHLADHMNAEIVLVRLRRC